VINNLARAISSIKGQGEQFEEVEQYYVNPKSITRFELYGFNDLDSGEWTDGVLALTIAE
jgi:hypothetical protein